MRGWTFISSAGRKSPKKRVGVQHGFAPTGTAREDTLLADVDRENETDADLGDELARLLQAGVP
jgi:hypothetical protein